MEKTLVFFLFILIGFFLKVKFQSKEETLGIKKIILNLALPATIFMALLSIEVNPQLLWLPVLSLLLNASLFAFSPVLGRLAGLKAHSSEMRTARLLLPSLAPGLSCFPFVMEYLGEKGLAQVAMADLGNKIFVLFGLYWIAMLWHRRTAQVQSHSNPKANLLRLVKRFVSEPVNLFITIALVLLGLGIDFNRLPLFLQDSLGRLGAIMTPLVLLFIGLSVKVQKRQFRELFSLLCLRAALVFALAGITIGFTGLNTKTEILLLLSFALSACSFWPFAHITSVSTQEKGRKAEEITFCPNYAINLLALSFPLSTLLILGVLNSGNFFLDPLMVYATAGVLLMIGCLLSPMNSLAQSLALLKSKAMLYTNKRTKVSKKPATAK
jgi:predicted permease